MTQMNKPDAEAIADEVARAIFQRHGQGFEHARALVLDALNRTAPPPSPVPADARRPELTSELRLALTGLCECWEDDVDVRPNSSIAIRVRAALRQAIDAAMPPNPAPPAQEQETEDMRMYGTVTQALIEAFELQCLPMQAVTFAHGKYEAATARIAELESSLEETRTAYACCRELIEAYQMCHDVDVDWEKFPAVTLSAAHEQVVALRAEIAQLKAKLGEG